MHWPLGGAPEHRRCSEQIVDYVAGRLDSRSRAAFQRHIDSCASCGDAVARQSTVWSALDLEFQDDLWRRPRISPDFDRRLFERIRATEARRGGMLHVLLAKWRRASLDV